MMKLLGSSRWLVITPLLVAGFTLYILAIYQESFDKSVPRILDKMDGLLVPGFLVHTPGCRIPYMDPFDKSISKYLSKEPAVMCSSRPPLIESDQTSLWIIPDANRIYNVTNLSCCYSALWRKQVPRGVPADNKIEKSKNCTSFENSTVIHDEYVKVTCTGDEGEHVYEDFHAFVVPKPSNVKKKPAFKGPSMLIIGVDAVSRLNLYRQMPKTLKLVKSHNAVELLGYNKVGDNTFPNLITVLSGHNETELSQTCWRKSSAVFDDCPWIWKDCSAAGVKTAFGEDGTWMGLFNYLKPGFSQAPTDYFIRPLIRSSETEIGHHKEGNAEVCVGARFATEVLLDYAHKFAVNMTRSGDKYLGFFWGCSMTHDYLNVHPNVDDIYSSLLQKLERDGVLDDTMVFFMSDHGIRWGPIRETYQGRVEERLPFMYVLVPRWFRDTFSTATSMLARNRRMLTSPFDLHETLLDLLDVSSITRDSIVERSRDLSDKRGISWFLPIPAERTCDQAGIPEEWCTCHHSKDASVTDENVLWAASVVVEHVNNLLEGTPQCARLLLDKVLSARVETPSEQVVSKTKHQFEDYIIQIETKPGGGKFETTVRHELDFKTMTVEGFVSRINAYGTQGKCARDYRLQLYCYCR